MAREGTRRGREGEREGKRGEGREKDKLLLQTFLSPACLFGRGR